MTDIRELRLFLDLAESGSYARTSASCHVSQSALSRVVSRIESEVGCRLLDRDRRGARLTESGVRFCATASHIVASWDDFATSGPQPSGPVSGIVSVYCSVTASQTLLPDLLTQVRSAHPALRVDLQTGYAADALAKLDDGSAEITVAPLPERVPRHLLVTTLARAQLVPVSAPGVASKSAPPWGDVDLVLPASGLARTLTDRWLARNRIRPASLTEAIGHEAVLSLVAAGYGVGIVPDIVAMRSALADRFVIGDVPDGLPGFDVALCTTAAHLARRQVQAFWSVVPGTAGR